MTETDARAVISVDVQNDFTGRSATAVDGGDAVGAATGRDGLGASMRGAPLDLLVARRLFTENLWSEFAGSRSHRTPRG